MKGSFTLAIVLLKIDKNMLVKVLRLMCSWSIFKILIYQGLNLGLDMSAVFSIPVRITSFQTSWLILVH